MDVRRLVLLALPGLALGITGATHPGSLSYATSHHWWQMHLAGMFVFPLVGVALASLVWGRRDPLALVLFAGAYVGARITHTISDRSLKRAYAVFLLVVAAYYLITTSDRFRAPAPIPPADAGRRQVH